LRTGDGGTVRRPHLTIRRQLAERRPRVAPNRSAGELLGPNHPLARGDRLRRDLWRQSLVTAAAVVVGAIGAASSQPWPMALLVVAAVVQLVLAVGLALHAGLQRERARELIIAGRADLPLRTVQRECRRLRRPRHSRSLAAALENLVRAAERWPTLLPSSRPVFDPRQVRATAPRLRALASRLRASSPPLAAIARTERLLTSGASPLYGRDPDELRRELNWVEAELDRTDPRQPAANTLPRS
jgi:hypothetical protein